MYRQPAQRRSPCRMSCVSSGLVPHSKPWHVAGMKALGYTVPETAVAPFNLWMVRQPLSELCSTVCQVVLLQLLCGLQPTCIVLYEAAHILVTAERASGARAQLWADVRAPGLQEGGLCGAASRDGCHCGLLSMPAGLATAAFGAEPAAAHQHAAPKPHALQCTVHWPQQAAALQRC